MKKKIAVFSTGWSEQMIYEYMQGIRNGLNNESADVYVFVCFPSLADDDMYTVGELNIFNLPNLEDFDGALVLGNVIDYPRVLKDIDDRCQKAGIPVVYTGYESEYGYFVGTDNYSGARSISEHLYIHHGIRDFFYIAGSKDNMDSNIRLQALKDVISENGGTFPEDNVFYSNWSPKSVMLFIEDWVESGRKLPEVFVCANDEMAILLCAVFRRYKINVPKDVKVTGFDNMLHAQVHDPAISTVSQRFDKIGYESAKLLLDILSGKECDKTKQVLCEFYPRESCGCLRDHQVDDALKEIGRNRFMDFMNNSAFYRKLSIMDRLIMSGRRFEDIKSNFKKADELFNNYEGKSYHVVLDSVLGKRMVDSDDDFRKTGYESKMEVVFSVDEGNYKTMSDFDVRQIVPQIVNPNVNHLFICLPLQEAGNNLGYIVFADDYEKLKDAELLGKYTERLSAVLIKNQQMIYADMLNKKLKELSETDALTHVKNRMAFQSKEELIDNRIRVGDNFQFALVLCDVNNLKVVNDKYGHENGDEYILNSCKLICDTFTRSIVYRLGGDEFVAVLEGNDYDDADTLLNTMNKAMEDMKKKDIPVWNKVSVAAGIARYDSSTDACLADVLKRADESMYNRKLEMKKNG